MWFALIIVENSSAVEMAFFPEVVSLETMAFFSWFSSAQGVITLTDSERNAVASGAMGPLTVILNKLQSGDLTPGETALDPSTGSVFVSQVGSGQVLASVAYRMLPCIRSAS